MGVDKQGALVRVRHAGVREEGPPQGQRRPLFLGEGSLCWFGSREGIVRTVHGLRSSKRSSSAAAPSRAGTQSWMQHARYPPAVRADTWRVIELTSATAMSSAEPLRASSVRASADRAAVCTRMPLVPRSPPKKSQEPASSSVAIVGTISDITDGSRRSSSSATCSSRDSRETRLSGLGRPS